jgi:hypothetical protein
METIAQESQGKLKIGGITFENSLEGLKSFMSISRNVEGWNLLRKDAKRFFSKDLIDQLDQSAYIVKLLCKSHSEKNRKERSKK